MRRNVLLLAVCQASMMTGNSLIIVTSALVGDALAADKSLATLPLALRFLAMMIMTIPASLLMNVTGRRLGFMLGTLLGLAGGVIATVGIYRHDFFWFCVANVLIGMFNGFGVYYRFAAVDTATPDYRSRAISYVMAGGVIAAVAGPNLANWSSDWISSAFFAGSYLTLIAVYALSLVALVFIDIPPPDAAKDSAPGRALSVIMLQPTFIVAAITGMLGYALMSLIMTATPLTMRIHEHTFSDTAFVIQWHVLGMFAPSFFTGNLIKRFGVLKVMTSGAILVLACSIINLTGTTMLHLWSALLLLGVGWNFLFIGATTLLTETYTEPEKAKTQAVNDFLVFTAVTAAVLSAGWLQHFVGWKAVNAGALPFILLMLAAIYWLQRVREKSVSRHVDSAREKLGPGVD